jgi:thiol-disulfide isomerase/thioredoxin
MKKISLLFVFVLFNVLLIQAKDGYNIKVKVKGIKDTICYLANYYGDKQYLKDTANVDSKGNFVFQGQEQLPGGIYIIVLPDKKYFEFIVNKEQRFSLETDINDLVKNMKIKGSPENKLFYDYLNFINKKQQEIMPLKETLKNIKNNKDSTNLIQKNIKEINEQVKSYKIKFIDDNPKTFIAKIFNASKEIDIPESPVLENGKKDSLFAYKYYKKHFFDNIDFTDDRLLRTPVFSNKLNQYMTTVIVPHPDTIIKESDAIIEKALTNKEIFKYVVSFLTNKYLTSNIMGYDAIFVHLAEKYYMTNQAYWVSPANLKKIIKKAKTLKPLLIGKKAPNLIMEDTIGLVYSLYNIKAKYTIILFWNVNCGFCKKEMPKLKKLYDNKSLKTEVYAVYTSTDIEKWKDYIKKEKLKWINVGGKKCNINYRKVYDVYSVPTLYLLNENKEIIAKKINIYQIQGFIKRDMKHP